MMKPPLTGEVDAALAEKHESGELKIDAGPLAGKFSNAVRVAVSGAIIVMLAVATFLVAMLAEIDYSGVSEALWIAGWVLLMVGLALMGFAWNIRTEKEARLEEEMLKVEPRSFGLDYSTPRIVMVRCKYCGTLNAENVSKCHSCGATL